MIVYNLLFLILTNTLLPYIPITPEVYLPLPLFAQSLWKTKSAFEILQLNRLHNETQLKSAFRNAMKEYHPDVGGDAQTFDLVRNIKNVLTRNQRDLYDCLAITEFPNPNKVEQIRMLIENKRVVWLADCAMFYIVTFIFMNGVTIHANQRKCRKYLLALLMLALAQEFLAYNYPDQPTVTDWFYPMMPLFQQSVLIRDFLSILIVIVRIKQIRKNTQQLTCIKNLEKEPNNTQFVLKNLTKLSEVYDTKVREKMQYQSSLLYKVKKYLSKGLSIGLMILTLVSIFSR